MSSTSDAIPEPMAGPAKGDFADWLSPMLVKELRQGLRARAFTGMFIIVQVLMVLATFISLSSNSANSAVGGFFWGFLALVLGLLLPLRGLQAVSSESSEKTLDLLVLTKLQSFRIVAGKWASLVAQGALLAVAVLPYIFLRYFLGGVNVIQDLLLLLILLLASAILSAITVCLSTGTAFAGKRNAGAVGALISLFIVFFGGSMLMSFIYSGSGTMMFFDLNRWQTAGALALVVLYGAFLVFFLLKVAAGRIEPVASNHSTARRVLALGLGAVFCLLSLLSVQPTDFWIGIGVFTLALAALDAVVDLPSHVRSVLEPFHRRGVGRLAYVFAPGWHTGAFFAMICWGFYLLFLVAGDVSGEDFWVAAVMPPAILLMPAALTVCFARGRATPFRIYLTIQLVCTVLAAVCAGLAETMDEIGYTLFPNFLMPHAGAGVLNESSSNLIDNSALVLCGIHLVGAFLLLLLRGKPMFQRMGDQLGSLDADPETEG